MKVISGFQTGADIAGIKAAYDSNLETGGYIPKDFKTELGNKPNYIMYGAIETNSPNYEHRTLKNVLHSDFTIIFDYAGSGGSKLTKNLCSKNNKPYLYLTKSKIDKPDIVDVIFKELINNKYNIINIAGNRESKCKGIEKKVYNILYDVFAKYNEIKNKK
jgi:hypothetical protein